MEFPASHSTLVWEGQTAEKDGDAFFHLSYEWTAGHWNGLISHQSHSNISEIKRFLAELKKSVSFHWYPPISVPKRKSVVPVLVKMSPYINCNETNNVSVTQVEHCQPKWVNRVSEIVVVANFCVSCVRSHTDMIFVKTFTLADFGPVILYPKARNLLESWSVARWSLAIISLYA